MATAGSAILHQQVLAALLGVKCPDMNNTIALLPELLHG
jgi:hypothetical protein